MKKNQLSHSLTEEELLTRLEIQERSLKAFAKEIYENIGQILVLARLQLSTINLNLRQESEEKIRESGKLVSRAIGDLRSLAKQLSPDEIIKKGFADAISFELDRLEKAGVCEAGFRSEGDYYKLDAARELIIFGILQGLVCKLLTHGHTKELQIEVAYLPERIVICTKFKAVEADMEGFIAGIIAGNKFISGKDNIHGEVDVTHHEDEGRICLTIKRN